ncbi:hypothetical protein [Halobacillus seohaensis]|uniref:DUF4145 domain-containing protein n=1 Tax=Halobacillus seohaensis TaxID=447421 RepID=A0ABW2EM19_9BACI
MGRTTIAQWKDFKDSKVPAILDTRCPECKRNRKMFATNHVWNHNHTQLMITITCTHCSSQRESWVQNVTNTSCQLTMAEEIIEPSETTSPDQLYQQAVHSFHEKDFQESNHLIYQAIYQLLQFITLDEDPINKPLLQLLRKLPDTINMHAYFDELIFQMEKYQILRPKQENLMIIFEIYELLRTVSRTTPERFMEISESMDLMR